MTDQFITAVIYVLGAIGIAYALLGRKGKR